MERDIVRITKSRRDRMVENNVCEGLYDVVKVCSCLGEYDIWYQRRQRVSSLECSFVVVFDCELFPST